MIKKIVSVLVVAILLLMGVFSLCACDDQDATDKLTIVYLGDSIAEALIGPSPISERDNYGYYALVGKCNNFNYYNHSISGNMTSGGFNGGNGLVGLLTKEDEDSYLVKTHIQQADIVHISVLGNNVLQYDLGLMLLELVDEDWYVGTSNEIFDEYVSGYKFTSKDASLFTHLRDGVEISSSRNRGKRPSVKLDSNGNLLVGTGTDVTFKFPPTMSDIDTIISIIKELNPDVKIIFQTVYNPVYEGTSLLEPAIEEALSRYGYTTIAQIRELAQGILDILNGFLEEYLQTHEGAFEILDTNVAFERITNIDMDGDSVDLSTNSLGRSLIFADYIHPSNLGHAIIAGATQAMLEELGLADESALDNYKDIRLEQIERMYSSIQNFDTQGAKDAIASATSFDNVSLAYFAAIDGYTPLYA